MQPQLKIFLILFGITILSVPSQLGSSYDDLFQRLTKKNDLLNVKNELIIEQRMIMGERNNDITNSINYAKGIQESSLPGKETNLRQKNNPLVIM